MRRIRAVIIIIIILSAVLPLIAFGEKGLSIRMVRHFSYPTFTRVVFEAESAAAYVLTKSGDGRALIFSAYEAPLSLAAQLPAINDGVVKSMEFLKDEGRAYIRIHLGSAAGEVKDFVLRNPDRIVLDISRMQAAPPPAPKRRTDRTIVIDPGHGGKDSGLVFAQGMEKSIALDLGRSIGSMLKKRDPGLRVVLTREKDQSVSIDERAGMANSMAADLFVSIHLAEGRDVRVFTIGLGNEQQAEPPVAPKDFLGFDAEAEFKKARWGGQQSKHLGDSTLLAKKILKQIMGEAGEPVQAPLALLSSVDSPAVMIEIGIQNDRSKIIEAVSKGIEQYIHESR